MVWGIKSPTSSPEAEALLSTDMQILMFQDYVRRISSAELGPLGSFVFTALPDH